MAAGADTLSIQGVKVNTRQTTNYTKLMCSAYTDLYSSCYTCTVFLESVVSPLSHCSHLQLHGNTTQLVG